MLALKFNVEGRDLGSVVTDAIAAVKRDVKVPDGNYLVWGGEFENQKRALGAAGRDRAVLVPGRVRAAPAWRWDPVAAPLSVLVVAPFAMTGGVFGLLAARIPLSVSAAVGFIALLGQVCLASLLVVSAVEQRRRTARICCTRLIGRHGQQIPHGADDRAAGHARADAGRPVGRRRQRDAAAVRRGHHQRPGDGGGGHAVRPAVRVLPHRRETATERERRRWGQRGCGVMKFWLATALLIAGLLESTQASAQAGSPALPTDVTLSDVLKLLEERSPRTIAGRASIAVTAADRISAETFPNPTVSYGGLHLVSGLSTGAVTQHQVVLEQPLLMFHQRQARFDAADASVNSETARVAEALAARRLSVRGTFASLLSRQEQQRILQESLTDMERVQQLVRGRAAAGDRSQYRRDSGGS